MLVGEVIAALDRAPIVSMEELVGDGGLVILAPHPDDETLGCGGVIAAACCEGRSVEVVFLTDGSASHPGSRSHPPQRLAAIRREEALRATAVLGVPPSRVIFLDRPDAAAPRQGPEFLAAVEALGAALARSRATALFVTWEHDPHCDHETAALVAVAVNAATQVRVWRYPIWGLHRPSGQAIEQSPWRGARFDVARWLDRKREALACHASQLGRVIDDDPAGFALTPDLLAPFLGPFERFIGGAA